MAGFLSDYSGIRTVPIGNPSRGYWVQLRETLSVGAKEEAERALTHGRISGDGIEMTMDTVSYRQLTVLSSIVAWNLDDTDGTPWPVDLDHIKMLPDLEFGKLHKMIDEMNAPEPPEVRKQFPDGSSGGDQERDDRAPLVGEVLHGTGVVATTWPAQGGYPGAPMA